MMQESLPSVNFPSAAFSSCSVIGVLMALRTSHDLKSCPFALKLMSDVPFWLSGKSDALSKAVYLNKSPAQ